MAGERVLPGGAAIEGFFTPGSDGWNTKMDENLRKIGSGLAGGRVIVKSQTTSLPVTGTIGDIYIVPDGDANEKQVAIWDGAAASEVWNYYPAWQGLRAHALDESKELEFDGTDWGMASGGGGGSTNIAIVDKASTQVVPSATNTLLTWDRDVLDPNNAHDPVTDNSRFVAWVAGNNWYRIKWVLQTTSTSNAARWQLWVALNRAGSTAFNVDLPRLHREDDWDASSVGISIEIEAWVQLNQNDYVEFLAWMGGGSITLEADTCFVEMEWKGPVV